MLWDACVTENQVPPNTHTTTTTMLRLWEANDCAWEQSPHMGPLESLSEAQDLRKMEPGNQGPETKAKQLLF